MSSDSVQRGTLPRMDIDTDPQLSRETLRTLRRRARSYRAAETKRTAARDDLRTAVRRCYAEGMTEVAMTEECGVSRMTIRAWLGK